MADEGLCPRCRFPRVPEDVRCRVCGSELPAWTGAGTPATPAAPPPIAGPPLPAPPTGEPSPSLPVPTIPPLAPAAVAPAKRRPLILEVLAVVAVLAVAGIAFALLAGGDDDGSPAAVADPSTAASSSPASSATSSPSVTPNPSPEPSPTAGGPSIVVQGVEIRLSTASRKERYVSGNETFVPGAGGDIFLIVRGTFEGEGDRIHDFDVTVVDENGRRDGTSFIVTDVILSEGQGQGDVEWVFAVSEASGSFTMSLPGGNDVDVTPLLR